MKDAQFSILHLLNYSLNQYGSDKEQGIIIMYSIKTILLFYLLVSKSSLSKLNVL